MVKQTLCLVALSFALFSVAEASTETVLYNFCSVSDCHDGKNPVADLVQDASGNLWGTTENGGTDNMGTIFELTERSGFRALGQVYSFRGGTNDGAHPQAGLIINSATGTLYGTTTNGGSPLCIGGCGTVFAFQPGNTGDSIIHFFLGAPMDGANPTSKLRLDGSGNLYGTTSAGGSFHMGTTFKIDTSNDETVIHNFAGAPNDGANPRGGLVFDANHNLWGTTEIGGTRNLGSIFKIIGPTLTSQSQVYSFQGAPSDGAKPGAALAFDPSTENLYGTTSAGGSTTGGCGSTGCGTIFLIKNTSSSYQKLYSFAILQGKAPVARLAVDPSSGNLYGTASLGGLHGGGTAFEICAPQNTCSWTGTEYTLFDFDNGSRTATGGNPKAGLLLNIMIPSSLPDEGESPPPSGGRGGCTSNCVSTTANGGMNGGGTVYSLTN